MSENCLFCKIVDKKIPAKIIYEDAHAVAFEDLNPQAPTHFLIIPRKHIQDMHHMKEADKEIIGHLFFAGSKIAAERHLDKAGYRLVINNGPDAGQTVFHIHLHVLSGRKFSWPPG